MAKIPIPVNSRDLREVLESSFERVPSAKVPGLLRTLEKIAVQISVRAPFEVGVTALRYIEGQWEVQPRHEDLLKEKVVIAMMHGSEKRILMALHSNLFGQLFKGNGHALNDDVNRSAVSKKRHKRQDAMKIFALQETQNGAAATGAIEAGIAQGSWSDQPFALGGGAFEKLGNHSAPRDHRRQDKRIVISEKQLSLAIKNALDGLEFGDLLALSRSVLDAVDALKGGSSLPAFKCRKRLVGLGDALCCELENEERTAVSLLRGLLAGLGFNSLMQLHGEFSVRIADARPRTTAVKTT